VGAGVVTEDHLAPWSLLPPAEGLCQVCAVDHEPWQAHNQQSLFYQYAFFREHGRWPTWADAFAHCEPELQEQWRARLREQGVPDEQLYSRKPE
jgi:hypothetical protein